VTGVSVVIEIAALGGRSRLAGREVNALMAV
jgi:adenine phosphoribosyltransferase